MLREIEPLVVLENMTVKWMGLYDHKGDAPCKILSSGLATQTSEKTMDYNSCKVGLAFPTRVVLFA